MRRVGLAAFAVLMVACGQASHAGRPAAQVSNAPSASSATPPPVFVSYPRTVYTPPPPPTSARYNQPVDLAIERVSFSCRLPVAGYSTDGWSGYWLSLPGGDISPAAGSTFNYVSTARTTVQSAASPRLPGDYDRGYDATLGRWVGSKAISPDGSQYVYGESGSPSKLHVVDVRTGGVKDYSFPGFGLIPLKWTADGVYVTAGGYGGPPQGAWLFDPKSGSLRTLTDHYNLMALEPPYAWFGEVNPADPAPLQGMGQLADELVRVSLVDGSSQIVLYRPGKAVWMEGLDEQGNPVVSVADAQNAGELDRVVAPNQVRVLFKEADGRFPYLGQSRFRDSFGAWFSSYQAIYLVNSSGVHKVAALPGGDVAGPCL